MRGIFLKTLCGIGSILFFWVFAEPAAAQDACVVIEDYRSAGNIVLEAANNCSSAKNVNVCLHRPEEEIGPNTRMSHTVPAGGSWTFNFWDPDEEPYKWSSRYCDAAGTNTSASCPAACPTSSAASTSNIDDKVMGNWLFSVESNYFPKHYSEPNLFNVCQPGPASGTLYVDTKTGENEYSGNIEISFYMADLPTRTESNCAGLFVEKESFTVPVTVHANEISFGEPLMLRFNLDDGGTEISSPDEFGNILISLWKQ